MKLEGKNVKGKRTHNWGSPNQEAQQRFGQFVRKILLLYYIYQLPVFFLFLVILPLRQSVRLTSSSECTHTGHHNALKAAFEVLKQIMKISIHPFSDIISFSFRFISLYRSESWISLHFLFGCIHLAVQENGYISVRVEYATKGGHNGMVIGRAPPTRYIIRCRYKSWSSSMGTHHFFTSHFILPLSVVNVPVIFNVFIISQVSSDLL